jgi:hypothetical protein
MLQPNERKEVLQAYLADSTEENWRKLVQNLSYEARHFEERSMQLWPGGQSVQVRGDVDSPNLMVKQRSNAEINGLPGAKTAEWEKPDADLIRKIRREQRAEMYQSRDILYCDSCLIDTLMKIGAENRELEGFDYEHIKNLYADPDDWSLEKCYEWLEENGEEIPDPNPWGMDTKEDLLTALGHDTGDLTEEYLKKSIAELQEEYRKAHPDDSEIPEDREELLEGLDMDPGDIPAEEAAMSIEQLRARLIQCMDDEEIEGLEYFRDAVRNTASDHQPEIYEWWRVNDWLGENLIKIGECVLDNDYGMWWGRCCTGQQYIMDGVLQRVADQF